MLYIIKIYNDISLKKSNDGKIIICYLQLVYLVIKK